MDLSKLLKLVIFMYESINRLVFFVVNNTNKVCSIFITYSIRDIIDLSVRQRQKNEIRNEVIKMTNIPFTKTTETGIKIYRVAKFEECMNQNTSDLMDYLNNMLFDKRLAGLDVEYHSQANVFYIHNDLNPNYSFTVHCTNDYNTYIVAPRNTSPNTYKRSLDSVKEYIENFFYVETEADLM